MRTNFQIWFVLLWVGALPGLAVASKQQPLPGNFMVINGDCNVVFNQQSNQQSAPSLPLEALKPCLEQKDAAQSKNFDGAVINIERYLEFSNPTTLKIADVTLQSWLGDSEDYLTLNLANDSTLPALNVSVQLFAPTEPAGSPAKPIRATPSHAFPPPLMKHLAVGAKQSTSIAVAPVSELVGALSPPPPAGYQLIGVGLSPNLPDTLVQRVKDLNGITGSGSVELVAKPIGANLHFQTIFGGKNALLTGVYLYFGKGTVLPDIDATGPK
jgi:hypothetical protein